MADFNDVIDLPIAPLASLATDWQAVSLTMSGAGGDKEAPLVAFSILPGTAITKETDIGVTVTDETELRKVLILVEFATSGAYEVAWDGSKFADGYNTSVAAPIANGTSFTLRRKSGWFLTPTIRVVAIDTSGNEGIPTV